MDDQLNQLVEKERAYWVKIYRDGEQGMLENWSERTDRRLSLMFGSEKQLSFLSKIQIHGGRIRVLDAGCGTGAFVLALSRFFPGQCDIYGIDIRSEALTLARMKADLKGNNPVSVVKASVTDLPWADGFFDIVHSKDLLEHLPEPDKAVRELMRVTRENGYFFTHVPDYRTGYEPHIKMNFHPPTEEGLEKLKTKLKEEIGLADFVKNIYFMHPRKVEEILLNEYPSAIITRVFKRTRPFWKGIVHRVKGYKYDILARKVSP